MIKKLASTLLIGLMLAVPALSQGRYKGYERHRDYDGRKCGKFVNCHDARDGRRRYDDRYRDRYRSYRYRRHCGYEWLYVRGRWALIYNCDRY